MIRQTALAFICAFLIPGAAMAQATGPLPSWVIDMQKSSLTFEATQQGAPFTGHFNGFSGDIRFDLSRLEESKATIRVDLKSVDSKSPERDASLKGAEWFGIESFPESIYTVSKFEKTDENQYIAHGELDLHGVKKELDLPLSITFSTDDQGRDVALVVGEVSLNRLDFGLGSGAWKDTQAVGNPVKVKLSVIAVRADAAAQ